MQRGNLLHSACPPAGLTVVVEADQANQHRSLVFRQSPTSGFLNVCDPRWHTLPQFASHSATARCNPPQCGIPRKRSAESSVFLCGGSPDATNDPCRRSVAPREETSAEPCCSFDYNEPIRGTDFPTKQIELASILTDGTVQRRKWCGGQ